MQRNEPADLGQPRKERRSRASVSVSVLMGLLAATATAAEQEHSFQRNHVLGTSFDLKIRGGSEAQAQQCEAAVLGEIQRLNGILWPGNAESEISRLMVAKGPFVCSPDLYAVLCGSDLWRIRTGGAFTPHLGGLIDLWNGAAKAGAPPQKQGIDDAAATSKTPAWQLNHASRAVRPLRPLQLDVAGLAKGYILDKALAAGRAKAPNATGILLDLGGDIAVWGAWPVDVVDPLHPADNAKPLTTIRLANRAVASSGGYARGFEIAGKRYSHILDPRTGMPAEGVAGATVVAPDAASADAAATALCVMTPSAGVAMIDRLADVECLIVDPKGNRTASRGWAALAAAGANGGATGPTGAAEGAWPKGYSMAIKLSLRNQPKRPMVAAWVADGTGQPVKMLALWGKYKYLKELRTWYSLSFPFRATARNVTRASRPGGMYTLTWDGTDGKGKPVGPGKYRVCIEIAREKGTRVLMSADVACGKAVPALARMRPNAESGGAEVRYGPASE